jgi:MarR family transcriptional regulator, multiple antibiotic resistance protein MarR
MAAKPKHASKVASGRFPPAAVAGYYTVETYSAEDSVGFVVAQLRTRIFKALDVEMNKLGFTAAQWPILRLVASGATPTAADLCRQLNYDTGSMTRMLSRLERKGVIVRKPSVEDRRVVRLHITAVGRKLHPKLRDVVIRVLNHLTAGFSVDEVHVANRLLRRMRDNLAAAYGSDL